MDTAATGPQIRPSTADGTTSGTATTPGIALVTGATGYIGSRLVPALLATGWQVRVLARSPAKLEGRPWADRVEVSAGDATSDEDLAEALDGVDVAYYLLHSMDGEGHFIEREQAMATTFADACDEAGVGRIVYLGGMYPLNEPLSEHLYSRKAVGDVFLAARTPAAVLQAAVIVGAGSASFEMIRHLTDRLPVMVAPAWLANRIQPIAVADVLHYLVGAASLPTEVNRAFDVGGDEVLEFRDMLQRYAQRAGLARRRIVLAPVMTPWLASHWVGVVTPVDAGVAKPLVGSLVHEVVVKDGRALEQFTGAPSGGHTPFDTAVDRALDRSDAVDAPPVGEDDLAEDPAHATPADPAWVGRQPRTETWRTAVDAPADRVWEVVSSLGGQTGWFVPDSLWSMRGRVDTLAGGPGHRHVRDHADLREGDRVDSWRVEEVGDQNGGRSVRLRSEMRLPGTARLRFTVTPAPGDDGRSVFEQEVVFVPRGLGGEAYWWGLFAAHHALFTQMHEGIVKAANRG
ncbi:DUF2867 domain-containing protein [Kytococcus schroeteri]|uniref:DUF2867 domain-containing protein n=1 Tax=Kytococcus schroeteri TaxID=138300 RepID=A0A2I1PCL4_9MICO|nr:DUF2867 domain-containing protein [Kytococcus schroeteri]PKZ42375.1 DUF2867 domain-containing protein [Kytococcus schroeteri]